ncbi:MAG TPA: class I SAM-dependent methyltransferase [Myxococcota bacterium]|nr:class I SAM-dependent methyltransferase [Myxococcota bacterium]
MRPLFEPALQALIDRLQARSREQLPEMGQYFSTRAARGELDWSRFDDDANRFLADKLVALEPDKAEYCYLTARSLQARRIVEVGTSYGVSTLYLAAAVRDNGGGTVIGTEYEPAKAAAARAHLAEAGLEKFVDLRVGDLRETLKRIEGPVDFVLMDIWVEMVRPAIELIAPHLRAGAVVVCDNTRQFEAGYRAYFEYVNDPARGFATRTLPFEGGLELTVKTVAGEAALRGA